VKAPVNLKVVVQYRYQIMTHDPQEKIACEIDEYSHIDPKHRKLINLHPRQVFHQFIKEQNSQYDENASQDNMSV